MKKQKLIIPFIVILIIVTSCNTNKPNEKPESPPEGFTPPLPIQNISFSIENKFPHDVTSFTEGFLFHNGKLYESTGAPENLPQTKSLFGEVDLKNGKISVKAELDKNIYFGEGIVFLNDKVFQLTYKNQTGFIYDAQSFKNIGKFTYANREGWGLTTDGTHLIMSDGTSYLTYLNPINFSVVKVLDVAENGYVTEHLNELEYINGYIYANIWTTNTIVKIDPNTGDIVGKLDLTPLLNECKTSSSNPLETNGIAYDSITDKILVTGKLWPTIFEIKFPH
jgi:glutaminyl-peptide cyclotransferase